jgi:hypothetical protein
MLCDDNQTFLQIQDVILFMNALQYYTSVQPTIKEMNVYVQFL